MRLWVLQQADGSSSAPTLPSAAHHGGGVKKPEVSSSCFLATQGVTFLPVREKGAIAHATVEFKLSRILQCSIQHARQAELCSKPLLPSARTLCGMAVMSWCLSSHQMVLSLQKRGFFIDNMLVRIHSIIEMVLVDRPCAMEV